MEFVSHSHGFKIYPFGTCCRIMFSVSGINDKLQKYWKLNLEEGFCEHITTKFVCYALLLKLPDAVVSTRCSLVEYIQNHDEMYV